MGKPALGHFALCTAPHTRTRAPTHVPLCCTAPATVPPDIRTARDIQGHRDVTNKDNSGKREPGLTAEPQRVAVSKEEWQWLAEYLTHVLTRPADDNE